tara:strand:- start:3135 stop:3539 length:405 start_codon:yes stop_codon:yes gene_type:complete
MLESLWNLVVGLLSTVWGLVSSVVCFVCDITVWLHVEAPRLEGLLIGVLLAWLMARRDTHPLLRVLSAPLKLVLDILDLAWDQVDEVASDMWDTVKGWTMGSASWLTGKAKSVAAAVMGRLKATKENLEKEDEK